LRLLFVLLLTVSIEQAAHLVHLLFGDVAQVAQALRQLAARSSPASAQTESHHRADSNAQEERTETGAALTHSPASTSSGAATRARGRGMRVEGRLHVLVVAWRVPVTRSCSNRNAKVPLEIRPDRLPDVLGEIPHAPLVRSDHLLAALVDELLFGVALLPLVFALAFTQGIHLGAQVGGEA